MKNKRPKVLMVDDEPRNIRLLESILHKQPYELFTALDGFEALKIIEENIPDLVLLDIMMPEMDGIEVCQRIKSNPLTRTVPVVMVTALHSVEDRIRALEVNADDFLSKPIDATELVTRVRSLIKIRQLYQEIERESAEKLRFMAGVSHDIRSPLNALVLSLEMLGNFLPAEPRAHTIRNRITTCIDHIQMLVIDVMNYYQIETGQFELNVEPCSLAGIIESAITLATPLAEDKQLDFELILSVGDQLIEVDHNVIVQVILNLLSNAIKYTPVRGRVSLRVYNLADYKLPEDHFPPVLALPPAGIVIEVEDNGCGIEPEQFERVFTEFQRLHAKDSDGVGLGLSVSRRLIQLHKGEIWFNSQVDVGSRFAFFIPA